MCIKEMLKAKAESLSGRATPPNCACMNCKSQNPEFKFYDLVPRLVRFEEEDGLIHKMKIMLCRWICRRCLKTMRQYPDFLEPYKRYITPTIKAIAGKVLNHRRKPYAEAVKTEGSKKIPHFYKDSDRRLSPSTCWRWITWMALLLAEKLKVHPVVATEESAQKLCVSEGFFHPHQARSAARFAELYDARRLNLLKFL